VVEVLTAKLIRRHPHCSVTRARRPRERSKACGADQGTRKTKRRLRAAARRKPARWPASGRAPCPHASAKTAGQASKVGSTGTIARGLHKIREEADEIEAALDGEPASGSGSRRPSVRRRHLARHLRADPEAVLRGPIGIRAPLGAIEQALAAKGKMPQDATLAEMDALWDEAKAGRITVLPPREGIADRQTAPAPERRLDGTALAHESDDLGKATEIDFGLSRQHAAIGIEVKRKASRARYRPTCQSAQRWP